MKLYIKEEDTVEAPKKKSTRITEGEGDYPHHESRVGELYNAVVPAFDEEVCAEASQVQEERFLKYTSYIPSEKEEDTVDEYLEEAHKITNRSDDFLLQVLYEHDFNINSSIRCLRKCCVNMTSPQFLRASLPYSCDCFCHSYHVYRPNHYRSYFKKKWGLMQLEKLNINMDKVNDLLNEGQESQDDEVCFICGDGGRLILCDGGCERAYHTECLNLPEVPKDEKWLCPYCKRQLAKKGITFKEPSKEEEMEEEKEIEEESEEYFETKKEKHEKARIVKKSRKHKDIDETYSIAKKQLNRLPLIKRDYSNVQTTLIPCPIDGCIAQSSTRTSLMSHARAIHPSEYVRIAKILGCNYSLDLGNGKIEKHRFSYICPFHDCRCHFQKYTDFEKHMNNEHEKQDLSEYKSSDFVYDEKVTIIDKQEIPEHKNKKGRTAIKRVSKSIQIDNPSD